MVFEKPSLRTRVSFDVGMAQLGGHALDLSPEISLGRRESLHDVAKNLERMVDAIMVRTYAHEGLEKLAEYAGIPVINGLTDFSHPCQALADYMTMREHKHDLRGLRVAYVGDGNNVCHSLMFGAALVGAHLVVGAPSGYEPAPEALAWARDRGMGTGARIEVTGSADEAVRGADVVYTDVWASMGQEAEAAERHAIFMPFQVNARLFALAKPDAIFMHCLPAHRGSEVTDEVIDSPQLGRVPAGREPVARPESPALLAHALNPPNPGAVMNAVEHDLIAIEDEFGAHNYHPLDVIIERAKGVWVWDVEGKKYLDCLAGYSAVNQGHCHPHILEALTTQASRVTLTSRAFRNDQFPRILERLHQMTGMDQALLMNSGAEAVETALKAARKWGHTVKGIPDGRQHIITCDNNFHGRTIAIVSFSSHDQYRAGFGPSHRGSRSCRSAMPTRSSAPSRPTRARSSSNRSRVRRASSSLPPGT